MVHYYANHPSMFKPEKIMHVPNSTLTPQEKRQTIHRIQNIAVTVRALQRQLKRSKGGSRRAEVSRDILRERIGKVRAEA